MMMMRAEMGCAGNSEPDNVVRVYVSELVGIADDCLQY
jgi:hypothetical protein